MPLVEYPDSSSDDEPQRRTNPTTTVTKRRKLNTKKHDNTTASPPPLPATFLDLYATNVRASTADDPALHSGRKRITPHVEGNWPTHVYLEWWPNFAERKRLQQIIAQVKANVPSSCVIHSHLNSDLGGPLPLHISLSRPLVLATEKKDVFAEHLSQAITDLKLKPFHVQSANLDWASNCEKTRWFLVLRLKRPSNDELSRLLVTANEVAARFQQPGLYTESILDQKEKSPRPSRPSVKPHDFSSSLHISIAWTITMPQEKIDGNDLLVAVDDAVLSQSMFNIAFDSVKIKIGNSIINIALRNTLSQTDDAGFGGR